jgi:hypothetical protein
MLTTRRRDRRTRRQARFHLESLDDRVVLSAGARGAAAEAAVHHEMAGHARHAARHAHHKVHHARHANHGAAGQGPVVHGSSATLPANVSAALQSLYQEYENQGGGSSFKPSLPSDRLLQISGTSVGVQLKMASSGDFNTFVSDLQADGLQITSSSATYGLVVGMLPIAELPAASQVAASVTPAPPPVLS